MRIGEWTAYYPNGGRSDQAADRPVKQVMATYRNDQKLAVVLRFSASGSLRAFGAGGAV